MKSALAAGTLSWITLTAALPGQAAPPVTHRLEASPATVA
jgi:hypothetical protein